MITRILPDTLHKLLDDSASQLAKYKVRVSFLSAIILHEDPPSTPGDALDPGQTSMEKLRVMADKYFSRVHGVNTSGYGVTLETLRVDFSKACGVDHIRYTSSLLCVVSGCVFVYRFLRVVDFCVVLFEYFSF